MQQTKDLKESQLLDRIRNLRMESAMTAVLALLDLRLARCKDRLVKVPPENFLAEQARAQVLEDLIRDFNNSKPITKQ